MAVQTKKFFTIVIGILILSQISINAQTDITDLSSGKISAQYSDSPSGEGITKVIDNAVGTKYLTFHGSAWIQFYNPQEFTISKYSISSANDSPERDPATWTLAASNNGTGWVTLDSRSGERFTDRHQRREFSFSNNTAYKYYRLVMTCVSGGILQLSEWELFTVPLAHEVSVVSVSAPVEQTNQNVIPKVTVRNNGASTESFSVTCTIDNESVQVYNQTKNVSNLAAGSVTTVSFPNWLPAEDIQYKVTGTTNLNSDLIKENDVLSVMTNTKKKVYMVGYSHLDLQWNWNLGTTLNEYIPNTLNGNFALFEKYPEYTFNFEGAYRYMLMKKHYPSEYQKLKQYIADDRWYIAGSMVEATDVNIPSPEALMRQILYGNNFFKEEFGKTSLDILLPDCFGFPYTLPTIAAHCGLKGFSTQKFDLWGGSFRTPFSIGQWEGVDGSRITAVMKPGAYDNNPEIRESDLNELGEKTGLYVAYDYYGRRGDIGGPPPNSQVDILMGMLQNNASSEIKVVTTSSDQIFRDLTEEQISKLDVYKGEFLMTLHGTGCYTSHADLKLLNRQNELMANAAERASVAAELFTGKAYPSDEIKDSWITFLAHGFHDDLTGTSIQSAYDLYSLPDYKKSLNSFTQINTEANRAVAAKLNTEVDDYQTSVAVVVSNPLGTYRKDIAELTVQFPGEAPTAIRVFNKDGIEVPSQILSSAGAQVKIAFIADVKGLSYEVFQVKRSENPCQLQTGLKVSKDKIENDRYLVTMDESGDVESIFDKLVGEELFEGASKFEVRDNKSSGFPAWEIYYDDVTSFPRSYVEQSAQISIADSGAAKVTLKVTRSNEGSSFTHYYSLTAGSDDFLRVDNTVNWKPNNSNGSLLKVSFYLTATNPNATYDLGIGTIERGNNTRQLFEVPAQQWADITNIDNSYGVAILNNCKYGWDKPSDNLLQLSLIHSPKGGNYTYAGDKYEHNFAYGVYGHAGTWAEGNVVAAAERLNQPLIAFQTQVHSGGIGKSVSFINCDPKKVSVMALKKAENGDGYIVRVREVAGQNNQNVQLNFAATVISAEETNGMEEYKDAVGFSSNSISFSINSYQPKTFRVRLSNPFPTSVKESNDDLGGKFELYMPYPNPSNSSVTISFNLPTPELVKVKVYNQIGQEVKTLLNNNMTEGKHTINWNQLNNYNQNLASGVYFVRVETGKYAEVQKITILK